MAKFPFYQQLDQMDCGPTCLRMIAKHYGRNLNLQRLRDSSGFSREGVSLLGIAEASENIGFRTLAIKTTFAKLAKDAPLPCIIHWQQNHFIVVVSIGDKSVLVADPAKGILSLEIADFCEHWATINDSDSSMGVVLLLEPTPHFFELEDDKSNGFNVKYLLQYFWTYRKLLLQLLLGLLLSSSLQLALPFLTQSIVDVGIQTRNIHFIYIILAAQMMLFGSRTIVDFIRSWILLHISIRINISILSDFLIKLMKLPLSFFDTKKFGDIMQRIGDHGNIEQFMTGHSISTLFSVINLFLFGAILAIYSLPVFLIFLLGSILYGLWVVLFLKEKRKLDFKIFDVAAKSQNSIIQLIQGMQEIKLANAEYIKRWEWERIQVRKFQLQTKSLILNQYQQAGAFFLNEGKNIIITFYSARAVVDGQLSLGTMLAIQYIIGQLNAPIESLITFVQAAQTAKISLERLNEVHLLDDETKAYDTNKMSFNQGVAISLQNLSFTYPGAGNEPVLRNVTLDIPKGKVTAIVGMSGSGKTTLLKLLLKFYDVNGDIFISSKESSYGEKNSSRLENLNTSHWRGSCGVVMQDGFIFSDSITCNIAIGDEKPNMDKVYHACKVANILDFVESLPLGFNTKIGSEGNGISQGQKQRLLIARAIYKNPQCLFLDEATNSLDSNNEKKILNNLTDFFKEKTVIVVAHRLSTVKNADQIVVLDNGKITELGTHQQLIDKRGTYYNLVKNQLDLGA